MKASTQPPNANEIKMGMWVNPPSDNDVGRPSKHRYKVTKISSNSKEPHLASVTLSNKETYSAYTLSNPSLKENKISSFENRMDKMLTETIKSKPLLKEWDAGTVLKQLGGNKFIAMTGAKKFVQDPKKRMMAFKIGRAKKSINYVRITLNGMDTYDMEFIRIRGMKITVVATHKGVYNDQLQSIFTKETGLYTHL